MIGEISIRKQGATPTILAKERRRVQRDSLEAIGTHWHERMLKEHFKPSAHSRYREVYRPRKGERGNPHPKGFKQSYTGRKLRRFGHTNPLVYTGESMRLALGIRDVRSTANKVRIVLHSRKFNFKHPKSQIKMYEEVTAITQNELDGLARVMDREFQEGVDRIQSAESTKVI